MTDYIFKRLKRKIKFLYQKITRGFNDEEIWNLDTTIANFVIPRLKAYKESCGLISLPPDLTSEEWTNIIDDIIYGLEASVTEDEVEDRDWVRVNNGLELFGIYFRDLWD